MGHSEILDTMYPETKRLTFRQVDKVVAAYRTASTKKEKDQHLARLLQSFHNYFLKYANILKGRVDKDSIRDHDTITFLALFVPTPTTRPMYGAPKGTPEQHEKSKRNYMSIVYNLKKICYSLSEEDVYNQLCLMFIELLNSYEKRGNASFTYYITTYLKWRIQEWLMKLAKDPLNRDIFPYDPDSLDESYRKGFSDLMKLDLNWVIDPGSGIFSILSIYERFILYLRYKEGLGYKRIAKRLGKSPVTVLEHLRTTYKKIKEQKDS